MTNLESVSHVIWQFRRMREGLRDWETRGIFGYRKVTMPECFARAGADLSAEALAKADNQQET
jgi:hypothetical protein